MHAMLIPRVSLRTWTFLLVAGLLGTAYAAPRKTRTVSPHAPGHAKGSTNAALVQVEIPKSVFIIPSTPEQGRDPFFPLSTRLSRSVVVPVTVTNAPAVSVELELKGISGAANHRLAIINNRTFGVGEEGEVNSNGSRVRITCEDIGTDFARVRVNGVERTLRLPRGF
jgi:hypothetical protein